jgi:KDO2-lipid IV(A) lauroyltransferase
VARRVAAIDAWRGAGRATPPRAPFHHFALNIAEFLQLASGGGERLLGSVAVQGEEHLERCRASGRGVVVLTGHVGNWELAVVWAIRRNVPLLPVFLPHPSPRVDRFFRQVRARHGVTTFTLGHDARPLLSHLKRGGWLAIMGDRDYMATGREAEFLGARVKLPVGYLRLAQLAGAWVLPTRFG